MNADDILTPTPVLYTHRRQVEFVETDMAGLVHFSNYFRWFEAAESAFFSSLGYPLVDGYRGWPRVRAGAEFHSPLRYGDLMEIDLSIEALKIKAIAYRFKVHKMQDNARLEMAATGQMTTLFVETDPADGSLSSHVIPAELLRKIKALTG